MGRLPSRWDHARWRDMARADATEADCYPFYARDDLVRVTMLTAASAYAAKGWATLPIWWIEKNRCACRHGVRCDRPGKHPLISDGVHGASTDHALLDEWLQFWPKANVAIATEPSGLVVLDVDHPRHPGALEILGELPQLPLTLHARTQSGGSHLAYSVPAGRSAPSRSHALGKGLDIKGRGSYVVAPPSRGVQGAYRWLNWLPTLAPAEAPDVLLLDRPAAPTPPVVEIAPPATASSPYGRVALEGEVDRLGASVLGRRNFDLYRAALKLASLVAGGELVESEVEDALTEAAEGIGLGRREIRATIASASAVGCRRPRRRSASVSPRGAS